MAKVTGLKRVLKQFKEVERRHAKSLERGLKIGGAYLLAESLKLVPVDTGVLRASGFVRSTGHGLSTEVRVGYTAAHAVFVHEITTKRHGKEYNRYYAKEIAAGRLHSRGPTQQAKFLERPAREKQAQILRLIKAELATK